MEYMSAKEAPKNGELQDGVCRFIALMAEYPVQ